eukprot:TRINITY_DN2741_c0_g1_i8.p2 TRINITY_DN2741_c0_g1~~TRINITY_DN2741_c0_g1_i8.p2  ORF type:complete len:221 (-),score=44.51 TRINITY_DN2741_c0_g1_i8:153-815(-)
MQDQVTISRLNSITHLLNLLGRHLDTKNNRGLTRQTQAPTVLSSPTSGMNMRKPDFVKEEIDDDDEEEEEEVLKRLEQGDKGGKEGEGEEGKRDIIEGEDEVKAVALVDPLCPVKSEARVCRSDGVYLRYILNRTVLTKNYSNRYYILQVLESIDGKRWWTFSRWGRVGQAGQSALIPFSTFSGAKNKFMHVFRIKTGNTWSQNSNTFIQHPGKYHHLSV